MANFALTEAEVVHLSNFQSGSASFGPLTINWNIDISIPQITVDATLYGTSIGHAVINTSNPNVQIGGSIGIASATVTLSADFTKRQLSYEVEVKTLGHIVVKKGGILVSW